LATTISQNGIDQALRALNYRNAESLKARLVAAVREIYNNHDSLESLEKIETEALIDALWGPSQDPEAVKACRKRLSSTKSAVNRDLKRLYAEGKNSEGIIIGRNNLFVMCDEAKDRILSSIATEISRSETATLEQIAQSLEAIQTLLARPLPGEDTRHPETSAMLSDLRRAVQDLSERMGSGDKSREDASADHTGAAPKGGETGGDPDVGGGPLAGHPPGGDGVGDTNTADTPDGAVAAGGAGTLESGGSGSAETVADRGSGQAPPEIEGDALRVGVSGDADRVADAAETDGSLDEALVEKDGLVDEIETADEIDVVEDLPADEADEEVFVEDDDDLVTLIEEIDEDNVEPEAEDHPVEVGEAQGPSEQDGGDGFVGTGNLEGPDTGVASGEGGQADDSDLEQAEVVEEIDDADTVEDIWEADEIPEETALVEEDDLDDILEEIEEDDRETVETVEEDLPLEPVDEDEVEEVLEEAGVDGDGEPTNQGAEAGGEPQGESVGIGSDIGDAGAESDVDTDPEAAKARHLAETFDGYLGTMERLYNQFVLVPSGKYTVGSPEPNRSDRPEQVVALEAFYIGKFPVTNGLFEIFVEKTGYVTTAERLGCGTVYYGRLRRKVDEDRGIERFICNGSVHSRIIEGATWYQPLGPGSTLHNKRNHPVVQVSLEDAMAFAAWTGKRIPTENEWEAAARTAKALALPWGDTWKEDCCNIEDLAVADTTPVDAFSSGANALGLVDTLGNVLEWTSDVWGSPPGRPRTSGYYIAKGGSWISEKDIRLYSRFKVQADAPSNIVGFRCVVL